MIQRIQTIFLTLAAVALGSTFFLPFATSSPVAAAGLIFSDGEYSVFDNLVLQLLAGGGIALAIIAIFMFKQRKTQLKLGYFIVVVSILLLIVAFLYFTNQAPTMNANAVSDAAGAYMPIAAVIFTLLANRFIRKDEKLVKSMDRLR